MAMMAMTTSNSIKVNALRRRSGSGVVKGVVIGSSFTSINTAKVGFRIGISIFLGQIVMGSVTDFYAKAQRSGAATKTGINHRYTQMNTDFEQKDLAVGHTKDTKENDRIITGQNHWESSWENLRSLRKLSCIVVHAEVAKILTADFAEYADANAPENLARRQKPRWN
jgi:hypothetical protein